MNGAVRVMVVDDHAVLREGVRAVLDGAPGLCVVGEAAHGDEALELAPRLRPDVVVLDLKMPGTPAVRTIARLRELLPDCRAVVFTTAAGSEDVRAVLEAGATGFLLKDAPGFDLLAAVRAVARGEAWLQPEVQRSLLASLRRPPAEDPLRCLTPRQRSVLELLGEGASNRAIAARLGLTEGTVKGYVSAVLERLGLADRTQAALFMARLRSRRETTDQSQ